MCNDPLETYKAFVKAVDPLVNATLKGHLLVEEQMGQLIAVIPELSGTPKKKYNGFFNRCNLLKAVFPGREKSHVWLLLNKFNKLRNHIGHELSVEGVAARLGEIRRLIQDHDPEAYELIPEPDDDTDLVIHTVSYLFGVFRAMRREKTDAGVV